MSTAVKAEPGTDVALSSASVGVLPPEIRAALQMRKMQNQVAGQLASMNWGKELDLETRRATADWGQTMGVDVTTEIDVLGKNIYLNSRFYLRKLGEMIAAGLVEYAIADHVENDPRLKELGPEGEGEYSRRLRERIMHAIPDACKSATVFRVKLHSLDKEIVGCKWTGTGKLNQYGKLADPVGEEFPVETSESRAARRCMRLLTSHVPPHIANPIAVIESSTAALSDRIAHSRNEVRAQIERAAAPPPGRSSIPAASMPLLNSADPYSEVDTSRTTEMETVGRPAPVRVVEERFVDGTLATQQQKAQITELLSNPALDLADSEIERIAKEAGARDYTSARAVTQIAQLERLLPKGQGLFGEE